MVAETTRQVVSRQTFHLSGSKHTVTCFVIRDDLVAPWLQKAQLSAGPLNPATPHLNIWEANLSSSPERERQGWQAATVQSWETFLPVPLSL